MTKAHRTTRGAKPLAPEKLLAELVRRIRLPRRRQRPAKRSVDLRWQDRLIEAIVPDAAAVLDLGCGGGQLLHRLIEHKHVRGQGVELDPAAVNQCVARDVPVVQANLDEGLRGFADQSFDYVVLEETLQTLHRPVAVLAEMLRVGRRGIVSFPNFGHWQVRLDLAARGRMPISDRLPYRWHDTPNIHLFTLRDFLDWARQNRVRIVEAHALVNGAHRPLRPEDDLHAEEVLVVVEKQKAPPPARKTARKRSPGRGSHHRGTR